MELRKVAQSPPEPSFHRSAVLVSPHSGDTHRGEETLSDTFTQVENKAENSSPAIYSTSLSTLDGGPTLRSSVSRLPSLKLNFGLVDSDQDRRVGLEAKSLQSTSVPVFDLLTNSDQETRSKITEAQSLASPVLSEVEACVARAEPSRSMCLTSKSSSPPHKINVSPTEALSVKDSLTIGDQLPPGIVLDQVLNAAEPIRLDDLKGKYVLLQFWAPSCSASIASLPQIDQLQSAYREDLQVVSVSAFSEEDIKSTFQIYPALSGLKLPFATREKDLLSLFPHAVIPHVVLLDRDSKVIAITGIEDITPTNLDRMLKGDYSGFRFKSDKRIQLDPKSKLISESPQIPHKNIRYQSAFTGYLPGVPSSLIQNLGPFSHIRIVNMSLIAHFQLAYSERNLKDYFGRNRIVIEGFGPEELYSEKQGRDYEDWMASGDHVFGYELIVPQAENPYRMMREDLNRFLPWIRASIQQRPRKILALTLQEGKTIPKSTAQRSYQTRSGVHMTNYPLEGFIYHLNAQYLSSSELPIIDQTGIDYPIDLTLNANLGNVQSLRSALLSQGFDLIEKTETIPVLVLTKNNQPNPIKTYEN